MQIQAMDVAVKECWENERGPCTAMDGVAGIKYEMVDERNEEGERFSPKRPVHMVVEFEGSWMGRF